MPLETGPATAQGYAIYAYKTRAGRRYRFVFRQSDGTVVLRRGFASRRPAATARRKLMESIDRGETTVCREALETYWNRFAPERRAYLTAGSHLDLTTRGRKRLVPFFGGDQLSNFDPDRVREWLASWSSLSRPASFSPKTVNNARTNPAPWSMASPRTISWSI